MPDERTFLIVGLGNPGEKYEQTRHNAGFAALDFFAEKNDLEIRTEKMGGLYCSGKIAGKKVLLLKPMNFMNRSGESVLSFMRYYDIASANMLVVHDDLDLASGRVKMVSGGGAGGHNGVRSLIGQLGTSDFARLKIGIGHPRDTEETRSIPVERYVLAVFSTEQKDVFRDSLDRIAEAIHLFIKGGVGPAMNIVNQQPEATE